MQKVLRQLLNRNLLICFFVTYSLFSCSDLLTSNSVLKGSCDYMKTNHLYQGHCVEYYGFLYSTEDIEQSCIKDSGLFNLGECDLRNFASYACIVEREQTTERHIILSKTTDEITAKDFCRDCNISNNIESSTSDSAICGIIQEISGF